MATPAGRARMTLAAITGMLMADDPAVAAWLPEIDRFNDGLPTEECRSCKDYFKPGEDDASSVLCGPCRRERGFA